MWPLTASLLAVLAGVLIGSTVRPADSVDPSRPSPARAPTSTSPSASPSPAASASRTVAPRRSLPAFQSGITLILYGGEPDIEGKADPLLDYLADTGVRSVSVAFPIYMQTWTSSTVEAPSDRTPTTSRVAALVRLAREKGFMVMLRPVLDEASLIADGQWRGSIRPRDQRMWFDSYNEILLRYADVAEREQAEIMCVGTELVSLEPARSEWLRVIERIRSIFTGALTYCANWDSFERVTFWAALDFVGVDGFFPLSASLQATVEELVTAWQPWVSRLQRFEAAIGKPLVLTEQGVTSQRGSHTRPWLWQQGTALDLEGQRRYYEATCKAVKPAVHGMYWWAVDLALPNAPSLDDGYNPLGKPAESALRACYR